MRIFFFLSCLLPFCSQAQIHINEVASDNETLLLDNFGESSDWIELYNANNTNINLEGYFLSDDADNINKWAFPFVEIPANGFLLIYASDKDEVEPFLHTNFKLSSNGESLFLSNIQGEIIDLLDIPPLDEDVSYGRFPDGAIDLVYFDETSPNFSNNNSSYFDFSNPPVFQNTNFFQDNEALIELSCLNENCQIYYTTNGSSPTENSTLYTAPFSINKTTTIRAISLSDGLEASSIASQTYFIGVHASIPIVAMSTNPDLLFDSETGLFEEGPNAESEWPFWGANYWKDTEISVSFEFYEADQEKAFSHEVGMKIHGGRGARTSPLKSIRFLAKNDYEIKSMDYAFFPNRARKEYRRLVLRNASGDFNWAYMRDAFMNNFVLEEGFNIDCLAARPVCWYINGEFWGLMYLREKSDEYYLQNNFDVDIEQLDFLEEDTTVLLGNFEYFDAFYDFVRNNDLSIQSNFETAAEQFDVQSLADYFIVETLSNNTDWPTNNIKFWRERKENAKWRYLLFDLDVSLGARSWTDPEVDSFGDKMVQYQDTNRHVNILQAFLENDPYKNYFINRYADLINSSFSSPYLSQKVANFVEVIDPFMPAHLEKWKNQTYDTWRYEKLPEIYYFVEERPRYARDFVQDYFDLGNQVELTLNVYPPEAGRIKINTIYPKALPWTGTYFNGVPVELTIEANPGFEFEYWQSFHTLETTDSNPSIVYNFESDDAISAYFKHTEEGLRLGVSPNPASGNEVQFFFLTKEITSASYTIYHINGQEIFSGKTEKLNAGQQRIKLPSNAFSSGTYILTVEVDNQKESITFIYHEN